MRITDDWTHWLFAGLLVWLGVLAIIVLLLNRADMRGEKRDDELVECHCKLVNAPHDWAQHDGWVQP